MYYLFDDLMSILFAVLALVFSMLGRKLVAYFIMCFAFAIITALLAIKHVYYFCLEEISQAKEKVLSMSSTRSTSNSFTSPIRNSFKKEGFSVELGKTLSKSRAIINNTFNKLNEEKEEKEDVKSNNNLNKQNIFAMPTMKNQTTKKKVNN